MLHKEIPFLRLVLPLCGGIIVGLYINPDIGTLVLCALFAITGLCTSLLLNGYKNNIVFGVIISFFLFLCGLSLYKYEKERISVLPVEESLLLCTLDDFPDEKEKSYKMIVNLNGIIDQDTVIPLSGSMIIYFRKDLHADSLLPGDNLIIRCLPIEITNRGNPYEFDYKFYMETQGVKYYALASNRNILSHTSPKKRRITHQALIVRNRIIEMYKSSRITGEKLSIVSAITLGNKKMLDPETKQNFIKAGVIHIMAVSGLHTAILCAFVFNLLFFLKHRFKILRVLMTIMVLWSFAFITGLSPSVTRATLMLSFYLLGNILNRKVNGINSVLASAFVLILVKPSVIFETGFLLSYSAVIYILCFYKDLYLKLAFKNKVIDKIWQLAAITIIAQAGTLPITIMLFNRFPTYFLITNIIMVPMASLNVIAGCLIPLTYPIKFLSQFIASFLNLVTGIMESLTSFFASLPYSSIENIGMTTIECILLIITIFLFANFLLRKKGYSILQPLVALALLITTNTISQISVRSSNKLIVYNIPGQTAISIKAGKTLNIYTNDSTSCRDILKESATFGLKVNYNKLERDQQFILAGKKKILITETPDKNVLQNFRPDIIILYSIYEVPGLKNMEEYSPEALVVMSGIPRINGVTEMKLHSCIDTIHFINKSGAFVKRI